MVNRVFKSKVIFGTKFKVFFVLNEPSQFHILHSDDFKYDNNFSKLLPKNTQIRYFSTKYKEFLFLLENFYFEKFEGIDSKYDHRFFKFQPKKSNKAFSDVEDTSLLW